MQPTRLVAKLRERFALKTLHLIAATAALIFAGIAICSFSAFAACSGDALEDCRDAVNDARQKIDQTSSPVEKAKAAGKAVGDCVDCAAQALGTKVRVFSPKSTLQPGPK